MTVSIRPGRYIAAVMQRPNGDSRQGPWVRDRQPLMFWFEHKDERVAYLVRAILPERPKIEIIPPGPWVDPHQRGSEPEFTVFPSALEIMELRPDGSLYAKLPITHIDPAQPGSEQTIRWSFDGNHLTSWEANPSTGSTADPATPKDQGEGT